MATQTKTGPSRAERRRADREKEQAAAPAPLPVSTRDELFVRRDAEGKVVPVRAVSLFFGRAFMIVPVRYGYVAGKDLTQPVVSWPLPEKVALIRDHIVEPDMSGFTVEEAETGMDPWTLDELVALVVAYSGPLRRAQELKEKEEKEGAGLGEAEGPVTMTTS